MEVVLYGPSTGVRGRGPLQYGTAATSVQGAHEALQDCGLLARECAHFRSVSDGTGIATIMAGS